LGTRTRFWNKLIASVGRAEPALNSRGSGDGLYPAKNPEASKFEEEERGGGMLRTRLEVVEVVEVVVMFLLEFSIGFRFSRESKTDATRVGDFTSDLNTE
jgi:hypothetical protein